MEIKAEMLRKEPLVELVNALLEAGVIKNHLMMLFLKEDLHKQLFETKDRLDAIDKKLEDKRLSIKNHNRLVGEWNRISARAQGKIAMCEKLDELIKEGV